MQVSGGGKMGANQPNYEKLRKILMQQYHREVSIIEAIETGKHLLNIYDILLYNRGNE